MFLIDQHNWSCEHNLCVMEDILDELVMTCRLYNGKYKAFGGSWSKPRKELLVTPKQLALQQYAFRLYTCILPDNGH